MKQIPVPVDFSGSSPHVVAAASRLARLIDGQVVLVHGVQPGEIVPAAPGVCHGTS